MAESETVKDEAVAKSSASHHVQPAERSKGTFVPLIFGGAVATALGFFGGQLDSVEKALGLAAPDSELQAVQSELQSVIDAQAGKIDEQAALIAALSEQVAALPTEMPEIPEVDLSGVESQIKEQISALADVTGRLETLEKRPMTEGLSEEAVAAYEAELARLLSSVETQRSEIESMMGGAENSLASLLGGAENTLAETVAASEAEIAELRGKVETLLAAAEETRNAAEARAQSALARAAMARIITAVDSGEPYADAVAELQETGTTEVPEALAALAADGVPTLDTVQDGFEDVLRAALAAARSEEAADGGGGIGSFLQRSLGARSVTPQEGSSADAILSRVEDAVRRGRLGEALSEIDGLPQTAKDAMTDWIDRASARNNAVTAANDLLTELSTN